MCVAVCCSVYHVLQCVAVHCSGLQCHLHVRDGRTCVSLCVAVFIMHCSVLQCSVTYMSEVACACMLRCVLQVRCSVCCSVLQVDVLFGWSISV